MARRPHQFNDYPPSLMELAPFGPYRAVVALWVDGDTLDVFMDMGVNKYAYETIRLRDVNTPEINRADSREAGLAAKAYAESLAPVGTPVVIVTHKDASSFGRYVADVILGDGRDLGDELLAAGHATEWSG